MDLVEINQSQVHRHPWETARYSFFEQLAAGVLKDNPVIVDIGCGDAYFISRFAERFPGGRYIAIDSAFTPETIAALQQQTRQPVAFYNSFASFVQDFHGEVDLVLLLDVIEHIEDDFGFLEQVLQSGIFSINTTLFVSVPAFASLFSEHDLFLKHYRRYTARTLRKVLSAAGFQPLRSGYFFFLLLLPRIAAVLLEKITGRKKNQAGLGGWEHGAFFTKVVSFILKTDAALTSRMGLPGLSTYCICKKPA